MIRHDFSIAQRIKAAQTMIGHQFRQSPEHRVCRAIIDVAIQDAFLPNARPIHRAESLAFLRRDWIEPAELCGVDSAWIRRVLATCGLFYNHPTT